MGSDHDYFAALVNAAGQPRMTVRPFVSGPDDAVAPPVTVALKLTGAVDEPPRLPPVTPLPFARRLRNRLPSGDTDHMCRVGSRDETLGAVTNRGAGMPDTAVSPSVMSTAIARPSKAR